MENEHGSKIILDGHRHSCADHHSSGADPDFWTAALFSRDELCGAASARARNCPRQSGRRNLSPERTARQRIVLLFFGYTSCPDVCPTTLAEMKQVMDALRDDAQHVQVVFISVDPERDTPEKIQAYANHFHPSFIGLSGAEAELEPVWQAYSIFREVVQSDSALGVIVNHTARTYLVDAQGNLRLSYAYGTPVEDIVHDIKLLLKQPR
ncbi:MAG: SCO family protein [Chloroflexi bacterium]|nr:SCO family protein [Chloroflexota bacterium]